eukprot:TRINITY_DN55486_c0_g1_i1.p1 TRINITY_DN55486_c0_g1~~TRINITY_DN55486_c0_g1_i1.p1  ORF type:complete len:350 (+),score=26.52 TRINITY_DN55486_c0_g1_i1:184-1233(+)
MSDYMSLMTKVLRSVGGELPWMRLLDAVVAELLENQHVSRDTDIENLKLRVLASIPTCWLSSSSQQVRLLQRPASEEQSLRGERIAVDYEMVDGTYSSFSGWIIDGTECGATVVFDDVGRGWTVARLRLRRYSHRFLGVSGLKKISRKPWTDDECDRLKLWVNKFKGSDVRPTQMHSWIACELERCIPATSNSEGGLSVRNKLMDTKAGGGEGVAHFSGLSYTDVVESLQRLGTACVQEICDDIQTNHPGKVSTVCRPGEKRTIGQNAIVRALCGYKDTLFTHRTVLRPRKYSLHEGLVACLPSIGTATWRKILKQYINSKQAKQAGRKKNKGARSMNYVRAFGSAAGR